MGSIFYLLIAILAIKSTSCINSYIYLPDKIIPEELPIGKEILKLNEELQYYFIQQGLSLQPDNPLSSISEQQYTFLDEVQTRFASNTYFLLDSVTGRITTRRSIDRESMCLNRHCMDTCVETQVVPGNVPGHHNQTLSQCRLNLKILLQPTSNIVSVNIIVDDVNDNKPQFRKEFFNQTIPENVPVGYRIPIELAYDPDVGRNTIQYYELAELNTNFQIIKNTFELRQSDLQLAIIVKTKLDREVQSSYSFSIIAHDGGMPSYSGRLDCLIQILDINDNNPQFKKSLFKFTLPEDTPVGTQIGSIIALDLDEGLNAKIKYSLVGSIINGGSNGLGPFSNSGLVMHNYASFFDIDLYSGLLTLRKPLDYEDEPFFSLTVEARDCGIGSLPAYATIEITLTDCNDNPPEISVSFLNTLKRKMIDSNSTFKNNPSIQPFIIYLSETTTPNKFIAHVSINDKDSGENGQLSWFVELNGKILLPSDTSQYLKLIQLNNFNNNSFTINTGAKQIDREEIQYLNLSIHAWDHGYPVSNNVTYTFIIEIEDENDNKPKFDASVYNLSIFENNKLNDIIAKFNATDADINQNGRLTYKFKDSSNHLDERFFTLEPQTGILRAKRVFDREIRNSYRFYIIVSDNGIKKQHSASAFVNVKILDVNDNPPQIYFLTNETRYFVNFSSSNDTILNLSENIAINTQIMIFYSKDEDIDENADVRYYLAQNGVEVQNLPFRINEDTGQLYVFKPLDREQKSSYKFDVVCENTVDSEPRLIGNLTRTIKLNSSMSLFIKITDVNDKCPYALNLTDRKYIDLDNITIDNLNVFEIDYTDLDEGINSKLTFSLLNYNDILELKIQNVTQQVAPDSNTVYKVSINLKPVNKLSKLKLGKYVIKLQISDLGEPKCVVVNHLQLFIGNRKYDKINILSEAIKISKEKSLIDAINSINHDYTSDSDLQYDQINYDYDYNLKMKEFLSQHSNIDYEKNNEMNMSLVVNELQLSTTTTTISSISSNNTLKVSQRFNFNFIDYDHVLVFIMILIIILIGILIALLGTIYFYKKYNQIRIKKILTKVKITSNNNSTTNSGTVNENEDFEKLKYESQQYYYEKQKKKLEREQHQQQQQPHQQKRDDVGASKNYHTNLTPNTLYSSYETTNLSLSMQSTNNSINEDSLASSAMTKETKLNNFSVMNELNQQTLVSSSSTTSSSSTSSTSSTTSSTSSSYDPTKFAFNTMRGFCYTAPINTTHNNINIKVDYDDMIVIEHDKTGNSIKQIALPVVNNNEIFTTPEILYSKPNFLMQKEKQLNFMNSKNNTNSILNANYSCDTNDEDDDEEDEDEEYNEKFSFLNEYKDKLKLAKQNCYKNSEV